VIGELGICSEFRENGGFGELISSGETAAPARGQKIVGSDDLPQLKEP
jgi:hypothetical protein